MTAAVALGAGLVSGGAVLASTPTSGSTSAGSSAPAGHPTERVCPPPTSSKRAACMSVRRTDVTPKKGVVPHADPAGYGVAGLQSAYGLPSGTAGAGETVAIVDAFDDPNAEADLAVYRSQYGLPSCTTANGCFRKVDQRGGTTYPTTDSGWSTEISLDVDMVSAACPGCHILLVEADDSTLDNLAAAVDEAVALGAKYVSNSYGTDGEDPTELDYDTHYHHPGVVITASTGDNGFGVSYPAASQYVTSVGGTTLNKDSSTRGWSETAWTGAGSGCSAYEHKPAWQLDTGCDQRAVGDVSAVADPNTGVAVYDSYQHGGWSVFGGTSVSAPLIAAVYALAGPPKSGTLPAQYPYDSQLVGAGGLNDVTSGSNGSCVPAYLCTGVPGYDGPTGLGTPIGVDAFTARDHGDVAGTVSDAATGKPVAGVNVAVSGRTAKTDSQGHYDLDLPVGDYHLTAGLRGYEPASADVAVTGGTTTTRDFALTPSPRVAVNGTVTDGSGHGWPLYAKVAASDGTTAFTDPATGRYTLNLLENEDYTLHVTATDGGYTPADQKVSVKTAGLTQDVALTTDVSCTAAGYQAKLNGQTQTFDKTGAPKEWSVTNVDHQLTGYTAKPGWEFTDPGGRGNHTGGDGGFAIVDSDHDGQHNVQDTYLTGPTVDLSASASPAVQFAGDLRPAVNSAATVDLSLDGGTTWTTVWRNVSFPGVTGPTTTVVLLPQAAHQAKAKIRFHYTGNWSKWWAIDDVFVGDRTCDRQQGGLLVGRVSDAASGKGIVGATVTGGDQHATTIATPDDPALGDGYYSLFTPAGEQQVTATATGHTDKTSTTTITEDQTTRLDFPLS